MNFSPQSKKAKKCKKTARVEQITGKTCCKCDK